MYELHLQSLFFGDACHVHQAGTVGAGYVFGTGLDVALHLVLTHLRTDGRLLDGEHTAEAAAFVRTLGLYHLDAFYQLQQVLDLIELGYVLLAGRTQSQLAYAVTGVVQTHLVGELTQGLVHLHHIVQELHDVHDLAGGGTLVPAFQQTGIVQLDESRAADRRGDS